MIVIDDLMCFKLDNECLYSEQMLVEFNEDPVFYICKSQTGKYYVVLCLDVEEGNYTIINSEVHDILLMLYNKITMRNLYERVDYFWKVCVGKKIEDDVVIKYNIEDIDTSILPYEGAYFVNYNQEIEDYALKLKKSVQSNL